MTSGDIHAAEDAIRTPDATQLARTHDPDTSKAAALKLGGKAGTMRRRLLQEYHGHREAGVTAEEAAEHCAYRAEHGAWKRVSDLLNAGLLEDTGETRPGRSGRQQRVLRITENGKRVLGASS